MSESNEMFQVSMSVASGRVRNKHPFNNQLSNLLQDGGNLQPHPPTGDPGNNRRMSLGSLMGKGIVSARRGFWEQSKVGKDKSIEQAGSPGCHPGVCQRGCSAV
jgi:hypothetical protein